MATVKLQTNVPETIALAFADGMPVASQFGGDQVLFTLTNNDRLYVAPFVAEKIRAAGVQANEPFSICKRETVAGNRRVVNYEIAKAPVVAPPAPPVVAPGPVAVPRVAPAAAAAVPASAPASDSSASALKYAGVAAIDAVLAVEEYARSKGMTDFCFGPENIQKIWVALWIDARKGGRA